MLFKYPMGSAFAITCCDIVKKMLNSSAYLKAKWRLWEAIVRCQSLVISWPGPNVWRKQSATVSCSQGFLSRSAMNIVLLMINLLLAPIWLYILQLFQLMHGLLWWPPSNLEVYSNAVPSYKPIPELAFYKIIYTRLISGSIFPYFYVADHQS